jgi:aryl-alcohol dehydrogenase-like predicted oxidoreductase
VTSARHEKDPWKGLYAESCKPIVDACETIAKARGIGMAQVALAWLLSKEQVSAPIVGTTSLDNLKELVGML